MGSSRRVGAVLGLVGLAVYLLHCGPTVLNPQPCLPDAPSSDPRSCNYNDGFAGKSNAGGGTGNLAGSSSAGASSGLAGNSASGAGGAFASAGASAGGVSGFAGASSSEGGAAGSSIGEGGEAGSAQAGAPGLESN